MIDINTQLFFAIIMGIFIGGVAGYIGSLMVTKKMSLMGGALGHLTLPGIALALLYNFDVSIGALIFLIGGISLIWFFEQRTKSSLENLTAVVFPSSLAVAFLFLPKDKTSIALLGDLSQINFTTFLITIFFCILIFFTTKKTYSTLILAGISPDIVQAKGISLAKYNFIYLACIALTVALGVRIVGGLMTAALVAIPAATSKNLAKNLIQYAYGSLILGSFACMMGVILFKITNLPIGPLIIISSTILFVISLFFTRKKN